MKGFPSKGIKVDDTFINYKPLKSGWRAKNTETVKHVFDSAEKLKDYLRCACITEKSMDDAFPELDFKTPSWLCIGGLKLWLSYDKYSCAYIISFITDCEINEILNDGCRIIAAVWNEEKPEEKSFKVEIPIKVLATKDHTCPDECDYTDDHGTRMKCFQRWVDENFNIDGATGHGVITYDIIRPK